MGLDDLLESAGGLGGLAKLAADNPQILAAAVALLSPRDSSVGGPGGLGGLAEAFAANGLDDVLSSWTGTGSNKGIDVSQLAGVLGNDTLAQFANKAGIGVDEAGPALASVLPGLIDQLTPQGRVPKANSLDSALGGILGALG